MAQKVQALLIYDLDGSEADGTVRFGLDGTEYEIDLNAGHARAPSEAHRTRITRITPNPSRSYYDRKAAVTD